MALETEMRFSISDNRFAYIMSAFQGHPHVGSFALEWQHVKDHEDTYFDAAGDLHERGWSLRVRRQGANVRATLKVPVSNENSHGVVHEEIENKSNDSFIGVIEQITRVLRDADAIKERPAAVGAQVILDGIYSTLRSFGLRDLFTIRTTRYTWLVKRATEEVAELTLDDSHYDIGGVDQATPIRECRMEVELRDPAYHEALAEISQFVRARFNIEEVRDSKFDRGMLHYSNQKLRDKIEAKITVTELADYSAIIRRIDNQDEFLPGYQFARLNDRRVSDIYFDTEQQSLFKAGCYLRLREEDGNKVLTFRRLAKEKKYGPALQHEVAARGAGEEFDAGWRQIQAGLSSTIGVTPEELETNLDSIEGALSQLGLHRSLKVDLVRIPWVVEHVDSRTSLGQAQVSRVAKLKYDQIVFRRPGGRSKLLREVEFEVTGVEDESAAPQEFQTTAYETFVVQFIEACAHTTSDGQVTRRISAKYFDGMVGLGIAQKTPEWLTDGRLAYSLSLLREAAAENPAAVIQERDRLLEERLAATEDVIALKGEVSAIIAELRTDGTKEQPRFLEDLEYRLRRLEAGFEDLSTRSVSVNIHNSIVQSSAAYVEFDLPTLAVELDRMRSSALNGATTSADYEHVAAIEAAREAATRGDASAVVAQLKRLGRFALDLAQKVSAPVVTALIESKLGIKP